MLSDIEKLVLLRDSGLLRYILADDLYQLVDIAREVTCPDGDALYVKGEPAVRFFAIVHGTVALSSGDPQRPASQLTRGQFAGHVAALAGEPHRETAIATQGFVVALAFHTAELSELILRQPSVALFFLREMARHCLER